MKRDERENGIGQRLSRLHGKKNRQDNFWQHNIKDLIFKNGAYKCNQCTQKLGDNCIKYIDLKIFFVEVTSFLLVVKFVQFNNTTLLSLLSSSQNNLPIFKLLTMFDMQY